MSDEQKVWINEALKRAIALYFAQNSKHNYGCLFCDEADGPSIRKRSSRFLTSSVKCLNSAITSGHFSSRRRRSWLQRLMR